MAGEDRFSYIFSGELEERLRWFITLRWMAVVGLAVGSLLGPRVGLPSVWPSLLVVALFVAGYNLYFTWSLSRQVSDGRPLGDLRLCALRQMVMDLAALIVAVHFTGGLQSPLLPFFAFHMAIGTIMISTRLMYLIAGCTSLAMLTLYLLEEHGALRYHPLDPTYGMCGRACYLNMASFVVALFGIVYLTDSVTSRFKERNIRLHEAKAALQERTVELQRLLDEIAEVEERKSHYMRISAHQLRSPLGTVKTSLMVLTQGYVDPGSERGRKLLAGAIERVDGLLRIVNDLLELAKIREGRNRAPWARNVNLNQLVADIFDAVSPLAEEKEIRLEPRVEGVAILDWGIPPDLVYALENLVQNAIKYSRPGGEVTVGLRVEGDEEAVLTVEDRGIGIPAEFLDRVLDEFVRAPNARKHASEGTGLGLSIVREVVEAHGGRITVASVEGEGSTFTVTLPLHHTPPEARDLLHAGNGGGYRTMTEAEHSSWE